MAEAVVPPTCMGCMQGPTAVSAEMCPVVSGPRGLASGCMARPSAMRRHCMYAAHMPFHSWPHQASGRGCERPLGAWIPPPQSGSTVQQRARHQSFINDLEVRGHRFPRFGGRWRPEAAAEDATARGWGVADRARANPARFLAARLLSESVNLRYVHTRTCVRDRGCEGFHCA